MAYLLLLGRKKRGGGVWRPDLFLWFASFRMGTEEGRQGVIFSFYDCRACDGGGREREKKGVPVAVTLNTTLLTYSIRTKRWDEDSSES